MRARVLHATSQGVTPRTRAGFCRLFGRGTRTITHCDAWYCYERLRRPQSKAGVKTSSLELAAVLTPPPARAPSLSWLRRMKTSIAQILKNIGIGWLVLVLVAMFVMLAIALSNGGPAVPYSDQRPLVLLLLPGAALLIVGLLLERQKTLSRRSKRD